MITIAIDAGHGSSTAGKRTPDGYREHWINVQCAYYFEKALKRCGFKTTRIAWDDTNAKDDSDISILSRQKTVRAADCDASVSWHANAYTSDWNSANGVEVLIHSIIEKRKDSKKLAQLIQKNLINGTDQKDRGVKTGNFGMCNATYMCCKAAVLIEIGFMTNKREAELMKTKTFCKEQAEEACKGVCEYFGVPYIKTATLPTVTSKKYKVATNGARLALRSAAGTTGKLIMYVPNGTAVTGTGKSASAAGVEWLQVKVDGKTGWMHSGYLKATT